MKDGDIITHYTGNYKARIDKLYKNGNAELTIIEAQGYPNWQRDIDRGEKVRIKGNQISRYFTI